VAETILVILVLREFYICNGKSIKNIRYIIASLGFIITISWGIKSLGNYKANDTFSPKLKKSVKIILGHNKRKQSFFDQHNIRLKDFSCTDSQSLIQNHDLVLDFLLKEKFNIKFATHYIQLTSNIENLNSLSKAQKMLVELDKQFRLLQVCSLSYQVDAWTSAESDIYYKKWFVRIKKIFDQMKTIHPLSMQPTTYARSYFKDVFESFYNKKKLSIKDGLVLELTYLLWSSFYDFSNNQQYIKKSYPKIMADNPHNSSYLHWLRIMASGHIRKKSLLIHIDSHTDLSAIQATTNDPRFSGFSLLQLSKMILIIEQSPISLKKQHLLQYLNSEKKKSTDSETEYIDQIINLIVNTSFHNLKDILYDAIKIENFNSNIVENVKKALASGNDTHMIKNKIFDYIKSIALEDYVKKRLLKWIEKKSLDEILSSLYVLSGYASPQIATPLLPAIISDVTDTVIMLKGNWVTRVPNRSILGSSIHYDGFADFELFNLNPNYYPYGDSKNEIIPGGLADSNINKQFFNYWSPFKMVSKDTPRKTIKYFRYDSLNLFNQKGEVKGTLKKVNQLMNRLNKDLILGIDLDFFVTNSNSLNHDVEPISTARINNSHNVDQPEFMLIKNRLNMFGQFLKGLKQKPHVITMADSTNLLRANPSDNFGSMLGGNFTPPSLIFLVQYKLRTIFKEVYDTPIF